MVCFQSISMNLTNYHQQKWRWIKKFSKVSECFSKVGLPYEEAEIDRVHSIGKPCKNESSGLTMKPVIIRLSYGDTGKIFTGIYQGGLKMTKRNQVKILLASHWI